MSSNNEAYGDEDWLKAEREEQEEAYRLAHMDDFKYEFEN